MYNANRVVMLVDHFYAGGTGNSSTIAAMLPWSVMLGRW
jgi:hypothetical protein